MKFFVVRVDEGVIDRRRWCPTICFVDQSGGNLWDGVCVFGDMKKMQVVVVMHF